MGREKQAKMKNFKFILFMCMVLLLGFQVSADRYVNYDVYERVFQSDGTYTDSTTPITDVNAIGFVCSNADCSSVSGTLWDGDVLLSGGDNRLELTFPTTLQNSNGYALFIYKDGYRTWEQNPSWWGTDSSDPAGPYNKYLAKVEECHAPVEQMSVLNDVQPNIPLVISMSASLDATTYSALQHMGPVNYVPASLQDDYYSVATTVTLEIKDWNGDVVYTDSTDVLIPYSSSQDVEFTWTPTISGTYSASIFTDITDAKCVSPVRESASSGFHVLSEAPRNMCYTLMNDLETSNQFPRSGDIVNIGVTKLSNCADDNYQLTSIPTDVTIEITKQSDSSVVYTSSTSLAANADASVTSLVNFAWNTAGLNIGWYDILIRGLGNSALSDGLDNLDMNASESIYLNSVLADSPVCGNNIIESGEQCEDGNTNDDDGCSSSCQIEIASPICGNNIVESGEECDDGDASNGDGCSTSCQDEENDDDDGGSSSSNRRNSRTNDLTPISTSRVTGAWVDDIQLSSGVTEEKMSLWWILGILMLLLLIFLLVVFILRIFLR